MVETETEQEKLRNDLLIQLKVLGKQLQNIQGQGVFEAKGFVEQILLQITKILKELTNNEWPNIKHNGLGLNAELLIWTASGLKEWQMFLAEWGSLPIEEELDFDPDENVADTVGNTKARQPSRGKKSGRQESQMESPDAEFSVQGKEPEEDIADGDEPVGDNIDQMQMERSNPLLSLFSLRYGREIYGCLLEGLTSYETIHIFRFKMLRSRKTALRDVLSNKNYAGYQIKSNDGHEPWNTIFMDNDQWPVFLKELRELAGQASTDADSQANNDVTD